jgi:hypothetical protein
MLERPCATRARIDRYGAAAGRAGSIDSGFGAAEDAAASAAPDPAETILPS